METLKIPQYETWHTEYEVYTAMVEFLRLSYRLGQSSDPASGVAVLKQLLQLNKPSVQEFDPLFTMLVDAAFAYTPGVGVDLQSDHNSSLFTSEERTRWDNLRSSLKQNARTHTDVMVDLMDCQQTGFHYNLVTIFTPYNPLCVRQLCMLKAETHAFYATTVGHKGPLTTDDCRRQDHQKCWKSRAKMKQFVSMLECAQMSLPYYTNDERNFKARKYAIKQLKKDVKHKQKVHSRNVGDYCKLLQERDRLWKNMSRISWELETGIQSRFEEKLSGALTELRRASHPNTYFHDLDMSLISHSIYNMTCRQYQVVHPPYDTSSIFFNDKIERPTMLESNYCRHSSPTSSYGEALNYNCTVIEDTDEVPALFLKLKQGDRFVLKITSNDQGVGFGYVKPSLLTMKKWGFVFVSNITVDSKIQIS